MILVVKSEKDLQLTEDAVIEAEFKDKQTRHD